MKSAVVWLREHLRDWQELEIGDLARLAYRDGLADQEFLDRAAITSIKHELRSALRTRDENGVPLFGNLIRTDPAGHAVHVYKQVALFDLHDYQECIAYHMTVARQHIGVANALQKDCQRKYGVQIELPFGETASN